VVKVWVQENELVKKGQALVDLDDADYAARVKQAEAELQTAEAQAGGADAQAQVVEATSKGGLQSARAIYSGSSVGVASAEAQRAAARAGLVRAEADARKAQTDLQRARELKAVRAVPQERLDNAQSAFDAAQAQLEQARAQVTAAEEQKRAAESRVSEAQGRLSQSAPVSSQIAVARANAALAHARVRAAEAQLDLARLQRSYTRVVAPVEGFAARLTAREGQLLAVGQPVLELVPTATYVIANFKETQVARMRPGQPATIELDAFHRRKLKGRVESLSAGTGASFALLPADNASGNFVKVVQRVPVRIAWIDPPPDVALRAGLSAEVAVEVGR
jgi:membrane fusion protein (multidrug efflux system)